MAAVTRYPEEFRLRLPRGMPATFVQLNLLPDALAWRSCLPETWRLFRHARKPGLLAWPADKWFAVLSVGCLSEY